MSNVEQSTQFASESIKANLQPNDAPTPATTTSNTTIINTTNSNTSSATASSTTINPNNVAPQPSSTTTNNSSENNNQTNNASNHNNIKPPITNASPTTSSTEIITTTAISIPTTVANNAPLASLISSVTPLPTATTNTNKTTPNTITPSTTSSPPPPTTTTSTSPTISSSVTTNGSTLTTTSTTSTTATNSTSTSIVNHNNKSSRSKSKDNNNNSDNVETTTSTSSNGGNINPSSDGISLMQPQQPSTTLFASSQPTGVSNVVPNTTPPAPPKPKTTRPRKTPNNKSNTPPAPKPEPKRPRAKSAKAMAAAAAAAAAAATASAENSAPLPGPASGQNDKTTKSTQPQVETPPATKKRKSRSTSNDSNNPTVPLQIAPPSAATVATAVATATKTQPARRPRKKKGEQVSKPGDISAASLVTNNPPGIPLNVANPQLLSVAPNIPMGLNPNLNAHQHQQPQHQPQQPTHVNSRIMPGISPLDNQDASNRYFSLTISPYANYDYTTAASLTRPSLSRLFTSSSSTAADNNRGNPYSDELAKAFDELRENTWSSLSKCILDEAKHFDIPSLLGTLYNLRDENAKLENKVKDLMSKREQMLNMNLRLELPGPALMNHLNATSPNYSSIMSRLTISPKNLPNSSPSPATKSPFSGSSYNHVPPGGLLGPPSFLDRSSPLVSVQTPHSGVNSLKSSSISTPSPPIGALMAHGVNNRAGLMTVGNPTYMSNVHPSINSSNPLGANPPSSSYYPRQ